MNKVQISRVTVDLIVGGACQDYTPASHADVSVLIDSQREVDRVLERLRTRQIPVQEIEGRTVVRLTEEHTVLFAMGQATLTPAALAVLHEIADLLNLPPYDTRHIRIEGHMDARGSDAANQKLSADRAHRVQQALVAQGVSPARLEVIGYGRSRPIASNDTSIGRARNRRVDLVVVPAEQR